MKHTGKIFAVAAIGLALFMVAATTVVAIPGQSAHAQGPVTVGGTNATSAQSADNSQHSSIGTGSSGNTATNTPTNTQSQTQNAGSTGSG